MRITIKSGDIEISVDYEIEPPHPRQTWYGLNMLSFTESIEKCIIKASEQVLKMQHNCTKPTEKGGSDEGK